MQITKSYCDICKKETWYLHPIHIESYLVFGSHHIKLKKYNYDLCVDCYKKVINTIDEMAKGEGE